MKRGSCSKIESGHACGPDLLPLNFLFFRLPHGWGVALAQSVVGLTLGSALTVTVLMLVQKRKDQENRVDCDFALLHTSYENSNEI